MTTPEQSRPQVELRSFLRQGHLLSPSDVATLGLETSDGALFIVASHDCDCVQSQSQEPYLELIRAREIESPDGNYTNAKSPRTLHLSVLKDGSRVTLEIKAEPKTAVAKVATTGMQPNAAFQLEERAKRTFSLWLRSRYWRAAFPDALVERLREVKSTIEDAIRPNPEALHGVYIYFDPASELPDDQPYEVDIFLVYDSEIPDADRAAQIAAEKIKRKFEKRFMTLSDQDRIITWRKIHLSECAAASDIEFTYADTLSFRLLHFDHLSLRQDPQTIVPNF